MPEEVIQDINCKGRRQPERWVLVEIEEAYIHCSLHIPILEKVDNTITSKKFPKNTKGGDAFAVADIQRDWVE